MKRLICGPRAVTEALRAQPQELSVLYLADEGRRELREIIELAKQRNVVFEAREPAELDVLAHVLADLNEPTSWQRAERSLDELVRALTTRAS